MIIVSYVATSKCYIDDLNWIQEHATLVIQSDLLMVIHSIRVIKRVARLKLRKS